jgi:hypothetical protein
MPRLPAIVAAALLASPSRAFSFNYPQFCPWVHLRDVAGGARPQNSAIVPAGNKLRLVQSGVDGDGEMNALVFAGAAGSAVMARTDEAWSSVFTLAADRQKDGSGAGGFAFVMASPSDAFELGAVGSGLGYAGLDQLLAVEFDMQQELGLGDPDANHVSVHASGPAPGVASASEASAPPGVSCVSADPEMPLRQWIAGDYVLGGQLGVNLGGKIYGVNISWSPGAAPGAGMLTVKIESGESEAPDGFATLLTCAVDLAAAMGDAAGGFPSQLVLGFTAANYLGDGTSGEDTSNLSLHSWLLETSTSPGSCFPPAAGREPAYDAASDPPCQPIVPADLTCASLVTADPGESCTRCVASGGRCDCEFCGTQGVCGDKSGPGAPSPCGNKITAYSKCPYASASASPSSTISATSTATGTATATGTSTRTATPSPSEAAAAGAAQGGAAPLPPAVAAGVAVAALAAAALAGVAWFSPRTLRALLPGGGSGAGASAERAPLRVAYDASSALRRGSRAM